MAAVQETVEKVRLIDVDQYKYGFETLIESDKAPKGLSEDTVRFISDKKNEPAWMLEWRLDAYRRWLTMREPDWARVEYPKIDYQDAYYYSAPDAEGGAEVARRDRSRNPARPMRSSAFRCASRRCWPAWCATTAGTDPARRVAVDAVFDSVSVATTFKEELKKAGVIFMPISEAIREHPDLVKKYLGSVVPVSDNFFATLNSAVFSDGSFVYVPPGVRCPMELSTYFRINEKQFRPVRAHPHHRRQGLLCELSRRLHRAAPRREPASCGGGRTGRASTMPRSSIRRCRTGIPAMPRAAAASSTS